MDIPELEKIGLLNNDRKVYLALIELGSSTVSDIVKKCGLHRSYVYDILDKLIDFGLVGFTIKNNKKYFEASPPEKLLEVIEFREQQLKDDKERIKEVISELKKKTETNQLKQESKIFSGKQGIKAILEDIISTKKDFVAFGAEGKFKEIYKWYFTNWQKRRIEHKIKYKIIYSAMLRANRPTKEQKWVQIKFLHEKYDFPATTIVYGDKVAILLWDKTPTGFLLESQEVVRSFLNYFEVMWEKAES